MPSSNLADTVRHLMSPPTTSAQQIDLMDDREWHEYMDARYDNRRSKGAFRDYADPYRASSKPSYYNRPVPTSTTPVSGHTYKSYVTKKVLVQHKDGTTQPFTMPYDCEGWFDLAKAVYPPTIEKSVETITIPIERCEFSYGEPVFNACVYTASADYIAARWGRKLDESDRKWLARHPLATDGGIPQEYTITAIQQLVAPYGMKVSRVRIRSGALVLGDQVMQWAMALGCNPMALADRRTSNADAATLLGMDEAAAAALWRLEFSDQPLPGSIIGERGWTNTSGVSVGAMGGHARYLAPRAGAGDWFVSIQLAPEADVEYLTPPPDPEYVERKGSPTLLVSKVVDANGELIAVKNGTTWRPWADVKAGIPAPVPTTTVTSPVVVPARPAPPPKTHPSYSFQDEPFRCQLCETSVPGFDRAYDYTEIDICIDCAEGAWRGMSCPECNHSPNYNTIPYPLALGDTAFDYQCAQCKAEFTVPYESDDPHVATLIDFSLAAFDRELEAYRSPDDTDLPPTPLTSDDPFSFQIID